MEGEGEVGGGGDWAVGMGDVLGIIVPVLMGWG